MKPNEADTLPDFCRAIREREEKSTREFADELAVHFSYISKVELGAVDAPVSYLKLIRKFCSEREFNHAVELLFQD